MKKALIIIVAVIVLIAAAFAVMRVIDMNSEQGKASSYSGNTMTLKVFYGNSELDPELTCTKVFPVERTVAKSNATGLAALQSLFAGPTDAEKKNGYFMSNNKGVKVNSIIIRNGTAYADFGSDLNREVGGSCRVMAIRTEIEETLKQFSTVQNVIISVDGQTEGILEP